MFRISRPGLVLALLLAALLLLAACGGRKEAGPAQAGKGEKPSSSAPAAGAPSGKGGEKAAAADFYKGKVITWIVPWGAGGGYDRTARTIAPFLEKYTGATVIVQNVAGAGGLVGTNQLFVAEADGLTIGMASAIGAISNQLVENKNVKFDMKKFSWLGGISPLEYLLVVGKDSKFKTMDDIVKANRPVKLAMGGAGSGQNIAPRLLFKATGAQLHPVMGFAGTAETVLSVVRGETEGVCTDVSTLLSGIESGDLRPVVFLGNKRHPDLPDVPAASELNISEKGRAAIQTVINLSSLGRILGAPPGVDKERLALLQQGLQKSLQDQEFLATAKKSKLFINYLTGTQVEEAVQQLLSAPPDVVDTIREAFKK